MRAFAGRGCDPPAPEERRNGKGVYYRAAACGGFANAESGPPGGGDRRALCRFMGWLMLYLTACSALLGADSLRPGRGLALAGRIWMPIGIVCAMIYANTGGRFLKQ